MSTENIELIDHDVFFEYESLDRQHKKHINLIVKVCNLDLLQNLHSKSCDRIELIKFLISHKDEVRYEFKKADIDHESADISIRWYASRLFDLEFKLNMAENKLYEYTNNNYRIDDIQ